MVSSQLTTSEGDILREAHFRIKPATFWFVVFGPVKGGRSPGQERRRSSGQGGGEHAELLVQTWDLCLPCWTRACLAHTPLLVPFSSCLKLGLCVDS